MGAILLPRGHLSISGDIFVVKTWEAGGGGATGMQLRILPQQEEPTTRQYAVPNVSSAVRSLPRS